MSAERTVRVQLVSRTPSWQSVGFRWTLAAVVVTVLAGVVTRVTGHPGPTVVLVVMLVGHFAGLVTLIRVDPSGLGGSRHGGVS